MISPICGCFAESWTDAPASFLGYPEDVVAGVLVTLFEERVDPLGLDAVGGKLLLEFLAAFLEAVRDVLQEHQAEYDVLVLAGFLVAAQLVCCFPQGLLECLGGFGFGGASCHRGGFFFLCDERVNDFGFLQ